MTMALAIVVALGFAWSLLLFFQAVAWRDREQESGFGWALAGAALFVVVFTDRLPGHSTGARSVLRILPGVGDSERLFSSSIVALAILLVIYVVRVVVFYLLFLAPDSSGMTPAGADNDGEEDVVNDLVAPTLSYSCFAVCLVALVQPAYRLSLLWTLALAAGLVVLYYWSIPRLLILLRELGPLLRILTVQLTLATVRLMWRIVELIAKAELYRRRLDPDKARRFTTRLEEIDAAKEKNRGDRRRVIGRITSSRRQSTLRLRQRRRESR